MMKRQFVRLVLGLSMGLICCASATAQDAAPDKNWQTLTQDYAAATAGLMQARLANDNALNRKAPGTVRPAQIAGLQRMAEATAARARALKAGKTVSDSTAFVALAEAAVAREEQDFGGLQAAVDAGANVAPERLTLAKAELDIARAQLAISKSLASQPLEVRRQWQIELLLDEIISIHELMDKMPP